MIFTRNNIMLEKYYGRSKGLQQAEKECDAIVKLLKDIENDLISDKKFTTNPHVKKLEKILEEEFNVKQIRLTMELNPTANACTYMTSFASTNRENVQKFMDKHGKHGNPDAVLFIHVFAGLISLTGITGGELLAIILHEIGHQLNLTVYKTIQDLFLILIPNGILIYLLSPVFSYALSTLNNIMNTMMDKYAPKINSFMYNISLFITKFTLPSLLYIPGILDYFSKHGISPSILGYGEERAADSFVTAYGYGPELASGMAKLESKDNNTMNTVIHKVPILASFIDMQDTLLHFLFTLLDPHPNNQTRIKNNLDKLRSEIKDPSIDPEIRKVLENDLKRSEEFYEQYISGKNSDNVSKFTIMKRRIIEKLANGNDDWREAFAPIYDKFEKDAQQ